MKMQRFLIFLLLFIFIPCTVCAEDLSSDKYNEVLSDYDLSFFEDSLDKDTYKTLEDLGLSDFDYNSITSLSLEKTLNYVLSLFKQKAKAPLSSCLTVLIFVILSCFLQSFSDKKDDGINQTYSTVSALIITVVVLSKLTHTISVCVSSVSVAGDFIYAFVPVFCMLVVVSGSGAVGFSTNTLLLALSQGMSFLASNVFMPLVNCFLALGICSSLRYELHLTKLISTVKKIITTCISFLCGVFVSVLSVKTAVAAKADMLGIRSIRFAVNSVVPVIGSSISEGLLSIQAYSSLIKSSVGIVGIVAVVLVFLPAIVETAVWRISLSFCSVLSDVFGDKSVSSVLNAFREALLLANVIIILSMVTTVISIGILVAAGGGGK